MRWWIERWLKSSKFWFGVDDDDDDGSLWREGFEGLREGKESLEGEESERLSISDISTLSKYEWWSGLMTFRELSQSIWALKLLSSPSLPSQSRQIVHIHSALLCAGTLI